MRHRWLALPFLAVSFTNLLTVLLAGCVFRDAAEPRYFRPESRALAGGTETAAASGSPVRLQSVSATPFLRERIVWRSSSVEFGLYEQRRWSEPPASYVERALESALRDTPGLRLTDEFDAPTLRVEVVAFDEVLTPAHVASVALVVALRGRDRARILDRTFTAESPIIGDAPAAVATAAGQALDTVVAEVATAVAGALRAH